MWVGGRGVRVSQQGRRVMDLRLYGRVLWRYRALVAVGWVVAIAAALLATFSIGPGGIDYRQSQTYVATEDLYITAQGFQEGRSASLAPEGSAEAAGVIDPNRMAQLTTLYSELINSDRVWEITERDGTLPGSVLGEQYVVNNGRTALPVLRLSAFADSPTVAVTLADRHASAFREFIQAEQAAAKIPAQERVVLEVLRRPDGAELVEARGMAMPVVLFLAIVAATVALAFVLYNLAQSRPEAVAGAEHSTGASAAASAPRVPRRGGEGARARADEVLSAPGSSATPRD